MSPLQQLKQMHAEAMQRLSMTPDYKLVKSLEDLIANFDTDTDPWDGTATGKETASTGEEDPLPFGVQETNTSSPEIADTGPANRFVDDLADAGAESDAAEDELTMASMAVVDEVVSDEAPETVTETEPEAEPENDPAASDDSEVDQLLEELRENISSSEQSTDAMETVEEEPVMHATMDDSIPFEEMLKQELGETPDLAANKADDTVSMTSPVSESEIEESAIDAVEAALEADLANLDFSEATQSAETAAEPELDPDQWLEEALQQSLASSDHSKS